MVKQRIKNLGREVIVHTNAVKLGIMVLVIGGATLAAACSGGVSKGDVNQMIDAKIASTPATAASASGTATGAAPASGDLNKAIFNAMDKFANNDASDAANPTLWRIQPGGGTVMMEYNNRMANAWFAAQAGNWDMVNYQFKEMLEVQEVFETTKPAKAADLKKFEAEQLTPLMNAAQAKDLTAFTKQYPLTEAGCNACHKNNNVGFVKVIPPTVAATRDLDWQGQGK